MIFHDLFEDFRNNVSRYQRGLRNFELSFESNSGLLLFFLTLLCDWPRELAPYSTNRMQNYKQPPLDHLRFPALHAVCLFHFEFSLANDNVNLCYDWSPGLLWSWFLTLN